MPTKTKKFLIIDANSLIHRAYHALPPLTTKDGRLVNAVYGFANILLKVMREMKPDYLAVCFDVAGKTFRDEIYEDYKTGREEKPDDFYPQFEIIDELLEALNIAVYKKEGYEADDLIGTLSQNVKCQMSNVKCVIFTGDKDMLQLVDKDTEVEIVKKGVSETVAYTPSRFKEEYGFPAEKFIDYKALRGDPSDNIPGVAGVGEKSATELIKEFGSVEDLYKCVSQQKSMRMEMRIDSNENANFKKKNKKQKLKIKKRILSKLIGQRKEAMLSKKLVTIKRDVPLKFKLEDAAVKPIDLDRPLALIHDLGFKSLLNRLPKPETGSLFGEEKKLGTSDTRMEMRIDSNENANVKVKKGEKRKGKRGQYILLDSSDKFEKFIGELKKQEVFALDTETDSADAVSAELVGMSFCWQKGAGYYLPVISILSSRVSGANREISGEYQIKPAFAGDPSTSSRVTRDSAQGDKLRKILENSKIKKVGHNIKYDYQVLKQHSINMQGIEFDSMIASYLLNPGSRSHSLTALAFQEFGARMIPIEDLIGKKGKDQKTMKEVPVEQIAEYAAEDADYTWRLFKRLSKDKNLKHVAQVFEKIEVPLIPILGDMELRGIKVDTRFLGKFSKKLRTRIKKLEDKIYQVARKKFNIASPIQLKEILFERLNVPTEGLSRTKTGISTSAQDLKKLRGRHKIIEPILEFRELSKLQNTYAEALPKLVNKQTGRVHTDFNQTVAATGRLSSSNPNLQNIPIRTELGREIRKTFIAERGFKLISADYSQFELRIVASLSCDKKMIQAFKSGEDIHARTAADVYDILIAKVTREQRREAKEVNFGIIYGLGARGLAARTGISPDEAKDFMARYFELHPQIKDYLEGVKATAHSLGFSETLFGRRRYFPEINVEHPALQAQAERAAVNLPIQGSQADLIKIAMINLDQELKRRKWQDSVKMLLQVHDELVFEVKTDLVDKASKVIKDAMEGVYKLKVPIEVHVGVGANWASCK